MADFVLTPVKPQPKIPSVEDVTSQSYIPTPTTKMTKEDILASPTHMGIIRRTMETRFGLTEKDKTRTAGERVKSAAGWLAGQRAVGNIHDMSDEDLFESWQNYMRSFAGGQSVTVAAEVAWLKNAQDNEKQIIGQSYQLYDSMPNIFSEDTSWGEMFDGIGDYARAAIWDPATVVGVGVGRVIGAAGTKATAQGLKQAAVHGGKQAVKTAVSSKLKQTALTTGGLMLTDLPFAVGADAGWQFSMLETGQQEEWSKAQTAISALGAMILPATIAGFKGVKALSGTKAAKVVGADNYIRITEKLKGQMDPQAVTKAVISDIDKDLIQDRLGILFGDLQKNLDQYPNWYKEVATPDGMPAAVGGSESDFFKALLLGDESRGIDGLAKILSDAGVVYVPRGIWDKPSNFFGDIISELPKEAWEGVAEEMSNLNRVFPDFLPKNTFKNFSSEELGAYFKKRASNIGRDLSVISQATGIIRGGLSKANPTVSNVLEGLASEATATGPQRLSYIQNLYKRILTSHPGTTGMNVKGWGAISVLNNTSDIVEGALLIGSSPFKKGNFKRGVGTISGAIRRGYNTLNWIDSLEAAEDYLSTRPDVRDKLHQFIAGGVEATKNQKQMFEKLGLDPNSRLNKTSDSLTDFLQTVSGVKVQDEMTKQFSFISSLDQEIRKTYGMSYNQFMSQENAWVKMASKDFKKLEEKALLRTLRETFSKSYSLNRSDAVFNTLARSIEKFSNTPGAGFLVPFGQFFNNSVATMSDYTGINALRYYIGKGIGKNIEMDDTGLALIAKAAVGWSALMMHYMPKAEEKIESGLSWKQERREDGSIADLTYEFPVGVMALGGQLLAHVKRDGEVPPDLKAEAMQVLSGQITRDLTEAGTGVQDVVGSIFSSLFTGDKLDLDSLEALAEMGARVVSGFTRPLDPINQMAALMSDDYQQMDRRQGIKFVNDSLRYIDQVFDVSTSEEVRQYPLNEPPPQDMGRVLGGVRSTQNPSLSERVFASIGKPSWKAVRWQGDDPAYKNHMDTLIQPVLDNAMRKMLEEHPDFFEYSLWKKETIASDVLTKAKDEVKASLEDGISETDVVMSKLRAINGYSKRDQQRALSVLQYEGSVNDILDEPNADWMLDQMLDVLQNPKEYLGLE